MIRWTGLAPWESEFPFPGSLTSTLLVFLKVVLVCAIAGAECGEGLEVGEQTRDEL